MKKNSFDFSVVMSIYGVEKYLKEAVESLEKQTIGFERIQLIMVDDGSTDGCGAICDSYKEKHPDNVVVIHKENGGLSSARNAGLEYIEGRYVSFFDPDDTLSYDTFQKVMSFMDSHMDVDISCVPIYYFGNQEGPHFLNDKFEKGTRVADLTDNSNSKCMLLSAATAFYRVSVAKKLKFDTLLCTAEDAKENLKILLDNPRLGLIANTRYNYRKHGNSILDKSSYIPAWYLTYLERFSKWILDIAEEKYGYLPRFVQNVVMYDLQWKLQQSHLPEGVLNGDEERKYRTLLFETVSRIDDDIIMAQNALSNDRKFYLLAQKRSNSPGLSTKYDLKQVLSDLTTMISFIRNEKNAVVVEGYQVCPIEGDGKPEIQGVLNDSSYIKAGILNYKEDIFLVDIQIASRLYFRIEVPVAVLKEKRQIVLAFESIYNGYHVRQGNVRTGRYSPVSAKMDKSWYTKNGVLIRPSDNALQLSWIGKHHGFVDLYRELLFLRQISLQNRTGSQKALICRCLYHFLKPLTPDNIWLITDKADRADDNGEAFFKYLRSLGKKAGCRPVFAIGKSSPDYERIEKIGLVVPYMSWRYKLIHLLAEHTISAYSHDEISSPYRDYSHYYGDLLQRNKVIFLQHGIIKDDLSRGLNRFHKNFALFVTSVERERESIAKGNYGYSPEQVILTGLPRYDLLYNDRKNYITVMPTWYRKLCGRFIAEESRWELLPGFEESEYYLFYTGLLTDERLLDEADRKGYKIRFLPHPVFLPYVDRFKVDPRVEVLHSDVTYKKVFAESALITTDYSSVAFDFAYLEKPIVYTQFEENHYAEGYFDYESDGFGEIEHTIEGTVNRLIEYMENDCKLKEKYADRIHSFFKYHDKNNCERVFRAIKELDCHES